MLCISRSCAAVLVHTCYTSAVTGTVLGMPTSEPSTTISGSTLWGAYSKFDFWKYICCCSCGCCCFFGGVFIFWVLGFFLACWLRWHFGLCGFVGFGSFLALLQNRLNWRIQPTATTNLDNEQQCKVNAKNMQTVSLGSRTQIFLPEYCK